MVILKMPGIPNTNFSKLTNEITHDFIEYIEIGEKNTKKEQEVLVHWKF